MIPGMAQDGALFTRTVRDPGLSGWFSIGNIQEALSGWESELRQTDNGVSARGPAFPGFPPQSNTHPTHLKHLHLQLIPGAPCMSPIQELPFTSSQP